MKTKTNVLIAALVAATIPSAFAASQTWSGAPADNLWNNAANWVGAAVPGAVSARTFDVATFNSPLSGGIGGVGNPIAIDLNREIRSILFDTASCGAYKVGGGTIGADIFTLNVSVTDNSTAVVPSGFLTINPDVANPQVVNALTTRYQSSRNGWFWITNNAVSSSATLSIGVLTNTSANSRPLFLTLAGSNTGNNTIGHIDDNVGANGAIHIWKYGAGTWVFTAANDLPQRTSGGGGGAAHLQVDEGTLIVKDAGSLGALANGNAYATNAGVLQIDGVTLNNNILGLRKGGTIRMNGTGAINGLAIGAHPSTTVTLATTSASDVLTIGGIGTFTGGAADSLLNVSGPGTVMHNVGSTFLGSWSLNSGSNMIVAGGALGSGPNVHLAAGVVLDTTLLGAVSWYVTTAGISAAGTGTGIGTTAATIVADAGGSIDLATTPRNIGLTFTPTSFTGDTAHPALYVAQGSLSLGGNAFTVNNASGTPLGAGTYRLIQQASGSVASAGGYVVVVTGSGLVQYGVASISVSGGNVDMVVTVYIPKDLVWQGGNPDSTWNLNTTSNFLDGASAAAFNTTDKVLFNSVGSSYNAVNLSGTLAPGSVTVDAANDYTFSGGGLIGGTTKLIKTGTGTLDLQVVNSYTGGTIVSNGMVRLGVNNAIPGTGSGNVEVYTPGVINLNSLADTINGLYGDGTVDNTSGADATLTLGNNNSGGTFTGLLRNTAGTLSVTKNGNGLQVIEGAHTYSGATTINAGSLRVNNPNAIGSGASALTINAGSLLISSDLILASLAGAGGTLANASGNTTTNRITLSGAGAFSGIISDGAGGAIRLYVPSGAAPRFNGVCTYSGGTIVASGATLEVGAISAPVNQSGAAGTGGILASNNSTISVPTSLATAGNIGNSITFATPGSTVTFSGASQGNSINGQVNGAANDTNILMGPFSLGGAMQYSNFLGTVVLSNGASIRWFVGNAGGENTTFDMQNAFMFSRDPNTMRLGALKGTGSIPNPSFSGAGFGHAIWHIGAKGIDSTYAGTFSGSNSLVKVGAGRLTFSGCVTVTNALEGEGGYTNYLYSPAIVYGGSTTISNGVLALTAPNDLRSSTNTPLTLLLASATAVFDASQMGSVTYLLDESLIATNSFIVTNGVLTLTNGQSISGLGTIRGSVVAPAGTTLNPGNVTGVLTNGIGTGVLEVTNSLSVAGAVNIRINQTNAVPADKLVANSFVIDPAATLLVTNVGTTILDGTTFTLFSQGVSFTSVTLPPSPYVWQNDLAANGTIKLISGGIPPVDPTPTNITFSMTGNQITLSWPVSHKGWDLQTNVDVGNSASWGTVAGSAATNQVIITIDPSIGHLFYRMHYLAP